MKNQKIEMILAQSPRVKVLQKVTKRMKNAPILDFHCVARKLKWILTEAVSPVSLCVPVDALGVVQYKTSPNLRFKFKEKLFYRTAMDDDWPRGCSAACTSSAATGTPQMRERVG